MTVADKSHPLGPLVECSFLPREFIECNEPIDHKGNETAKNRFDNNLSKMLLSDFITLLILIAILMILLTISSLGYGCFRFGGQRWEEVEKTKVCCRALDCIECRGNRYFTLDVHLNLLEKFLKPMAY